MQIQDTISKNLIAYRKQAKLTQQELADMINYSDKAVSKWERGENIPDVLVLKHIADCFGITLNDLLNEQDPVEPQNEYVTKRTHIIHLLIALMSAGLVYLIATIAVVVCGMLGFNISYMSYTISLPVSTIVLLVFACIWGAIYLKAITVSLTIWSTCTCIHLLLDIPQSWLIYLLGIVLQILVVLWFIMLYFNANKYSFFKKKK